MKYKIFHFVNIFTIFVSMNYLRKISDVYINKVSIISLLSDQELEITPKNGFFSEDEENIDVVYDGLYFTANSAYLSQDGAPSTPGYLFEKEFGIQIPNSEMITEIIQKFKYVKAIKVHYCNGKVINLSRNDIHLNKPMEAKSKVVGKFLQISWSIKSIFSIAFQ